MSRQTGDASKAGSRTSLLDALESGDQEVSHIEKEERIKRRREKRRRHSEESELSHALSHVSSMGSHISEGTYGRSARSRHASLHSAEGTTNLMDRTEGRLVRDEARNRLESTISRISVAISEVDDDDSVGDHNPNRSNALLLAGNSHKFIQGTAYMTVDKDELPQYLSAAKEMASRRDNPIDVDIQVVDEIKDKQRVKTKRSKKKKKKNSGWSHCADICLGCTCVAAVVAIVLVFFFLEDLKGFINGSDTVDNDPNQNQNQAGRVLMALNEVLPETEPEVDLW